jgi:adenylate cyclase
MIEREAEVPEELRIRFRIGINIGDVIVDEHDIFGDGVNVAARLEGFGRAEGQKHRSAGARPPDRDAARRPSGVMQSTLAFPDKPSIPVLSFTNMSADPEQEFFADGIAEDITPPYPAIPPCS